MVFDSGAMLGSILFLVASEPQSLLAFAVLAFAAGMFPVGMFLGSTCFSCCDERIPPCNVCDDGELPDTITVTLNGLPNNTQEQQDHYLCLVTFSSECFGSGGSARPLLPGGVRGEDEGPIASIELLDGGSGYAILGRVQPEATTAVSWGDPPQDGGVVLTPSWLESTDACDRKTWSLESISVDAAGGGIPRLGAGVLVSPANGDTEVTAAAAHLVLSFSEPDTTATVSSGSGASLSVVLDTTNAGSGLWSISSVTVNNAGSGYTDGESVEFTLAADEYAEALPSAEIDVDGNGAIVAVTVTAPGLFYKSTVDSVVVDNGGKYYREDATVPAVLAPVTATLSQPGWGGGSGAEFSVTVDDDPESETFGEITDVTIDDGGDGYLCWEYKKLCCGDFYNGKSYVLERNNQRAGDPYLSPCKYRHDFCGVGNVRLDRGYLEVSYNGPGSPPAVTLASEGLVFEPIGASKLCNTVFGTETLLACDDEFSFIAEDANGATATVTPNGSYDESNGYSGEGSCHICCQGTEPIAEEIETTVRWRYQEEQVGTYIVEVDLTLPLDAVNSWPNSQNAKAPTWSMPSEQAVESPSAYWLAVAPQFLAAENDYGGLLEGLAWCGVPRRGVGFMQNPAPYTFDAQEVGVNGMLSWPLPGFSVYINTCDTQDAVSWDGSLPAEVIDCTDCHKTCWTGFTVFRPEGGDPIYLRPICERCAPTPMCRPTTGTYTSDCVTEAFSDPNFDLPGESSLTIEIH